ncbi:DNA-binding response regulator [Pedobacter chinensis]|uniref:DNA-binding response regulator n=1 Tax=Pedobacter chinensis TaxID=2282421 RepID=A0A369PYL8_9SPHI|nr:response regulator transcription factor [Pedobacter chinensis]RDC55836.1 DNA-binding response regulator [Pedobacter chinensis]
MKQIILAEDHKVIRNGLKMLLESTHRYEVLYEAGNGREVIDALKKGLIPDLIVSDIGMPLMDGIAMLQALKESYPEVPVLIMSMMESNAHLYQTIMAGAHGFLTKSVDAEELFFAMGRLLIGERYVCASMAIPIIDQMIQKETFPGFKMQSADFSSREIEILQLIGEGLTNVEMADKLFISKRTVEGHRQSLIDKTGARNTAVLMRFAHANGIID